MKRFRRLGLVCLALIGLAGAALSLRAGLAETLAPAAYTPPQAARKYFALPYSGTNFQAYSWVWHAVGRCYLRGATAATVLDAYAELEKSLPDRHFVYGETGWNGGGRFWPHRTHREGLSADFMTPVLRHLPDGGRAPATPSCMPWNLWGYGTRLDAAGRNGGRELDAAACIAHLAALNTAAARRGLRIKLVILDPPLLNILRASSDFRKIADLPFLPKTAWFPHDGHYHVDFTPQ